MRVGIHHTADRTQLVTHLLIWLAVNYDSQIIMDVKRLLSHAPLTAAKNGLMARPGNTRFKRLRLVNKPSGQLDLRQTHLTTGKVHTGSA